VICLRIIRGIYYKYFKSRYFNKIIFIYVCITASVFLLLGNFVIHSVNQMLIDKEIKFTDVVLLNMKDYLQQQSQMVKVILQQTYLNYYARDDIYFFLENELDSLGYLEKKPIFDDYFFSQFSRSKDIVNIYVHKKMNNQIYQFSKSVIADNFPAEQYKYPELLIHTQSGSSSIVIHPSYAPYMNNEQPSNLVYSISIPIKKPKSIENIGTLVVEFNPEGFDDLLSRLEKDMLGNVLVLLNDNEVLYDSSGRYYMQKYPFATLLNQNRGMVEGQESIINTSVLDVPNLKVSIVIPEASLLRKTEDIRETILSLILSSIVVCAILMTLSSNAFFRKARIVVGAMKEIRNGDLTRRIPVKMARDEIDQIAISFNKMSEDLQEHIQRVYLSEIESKNAELLRKSLELRQKGVELSALQARINPHFLYNSLEVIRMKAISSRESSIAEMIYILSDLFRNSLSNKYVVTIAEELESASQYMRLFGIRYHDQISFTVDADEDLMNCGIVQHILQPILENYTIHGYRKGGEDNRVVLTVHSELTDIVITVRDNGKGISKVRLNEIRDNFIQMLSDGPGGMGLSNVNGRLIIIFGERYGLEINSVEGEETTVILRFPRVSPKELKILVESIDRR